MYFMVKQMIKQQPERHCENLTRNRSDGGALYTHFRHTEQAENQNWIEDYIRNRTDALCDHIKDRHTRSLHNTLRCKLQKTAEREYAADA